jgi:hypothetical protein
MNNYLTPQGLELLMQKVLLQFPEVVQKIVIGRTAENREIPCYILGLGLNKTDWRQLALSRPAILIDGAHHARELTSISMSVYYILHLLFDYT